MQFRDEMIAAEPVTSANDDSDESRKWYVRLRIRDDRLAKLWVWKLADHDAIVWSESDERWKKLLAVPELRAAVRQATTSAYARKTAPSEAPVPPTMRRSLQSLADIGVDEPPTQVRPNLYYAASQDDEDSPTGLRRRSVSEPPPKQVDPFLRALTTSIPPAVHSNPAPDIPRAPRLPSFVREPPPPRTIFGALTLVEPTRYRAVPRAISQFSIKNITWAMLPVACAGVFALYLDRRPVQNEFGVRTEQQDSAAVTGAPAAVAGEPSNESLAALLGRSTPMCLGQPQLSGPDQVISPGQLEAVRSARTRSLGPVAHSSKSALGGPVTPRRFGDKSPQSIAASTSASADNNEFDKDGARTALRFAIARVRNCSNSGLSGSALITFAPSGTVQSVQLSQIVGDDVDSSCVTRALSAARVPPFTGNAVTVRKAF